MSRMRTAVGVAAVAVALVLGGCASAPTNDSGTDSAALTHVTCDYTVRGNAAKAVDPPSGARVPASGTATVALSMSAGTITLVLERSSAPCAVHSFESLAEQGYYTGTACHRLTNAGLYILQCGDPSGTGKGTSGYGLASETDSSLIGCTDESRTECTYPAGTVALADPEHDGGQFFMTYADSTVSGDYPVLGTVDDAGRQVLGQIAEKGFKQGASPAPAADTTLKRVSLG
ncbi:peptidylprolyl isomerase [uncultured Propionibacterium sp.]|uniref:peptidylprolyl isomerase n=1 Tax=uncultured Propionibacterium sp. TaxID=218066 RepID=UPI00292D7F88|nr:peptidylprolyl isomerase [uncultured Propionibacterium sp.]